LWSYVCRGYKEEELSTYMEGLHAYNEMKDIGQMLLGRLGKFHNKKTLLIPVIVHSTVFFLKFAYCFIIHKLVLVPFGALVQ